MLADFGEVHIKNIIALTVHLYEEVLHKMSSLPAD